MQVQEQRKREKALNKAYEAWRLASKEIRAKLKDFAYQGILRKSKETLKLNMTKRAGIKSQSRAILQVLQMLGRKWMHAAPYVRFVIL